MNGPTEKPKTPAEPHDDNTAPVLPDDDEEDGDIATPKRDRDDEAG